MPTSFRIVTLRDRLFLLILGVSGITCLGTGLVLLAASLPPRIAIAAVSLTAILMAGAAAARAISSPLKVFADTAKQCGSGNGAEVHFPEESAIREIKHLAHVLNRTA